MKFSDKKQSVNALGEEPAMITLGPSKIKLITFDLGNVLVRVDHGRFCQRLAKLVQAEAQHVFDYVFNSPLEPSYDTGKITSEEFFQQIAAYFRLSLTFELFVRWWNDLFDPMPGMEAVVSRLKERFPLYLLSNTNPLHFEHIVANYPIVRHCSRFILSYQVGSRKPEPGIYQTLIQQSGLAPEQIIFIDDKPLFVKAAQEHGIRARQFTFPAVLQQQLAAEGLW